MSIAAQAWMTPTFARKNSQAIGLLLTFIGEGLTLRMVQGVWPQATEGDRISEKERRLEHNG
jgi:hypothetical protein